MASAFAGFAASSARAFATAPLQSRLFRFGSQKRSRIVVSISASRGGPAGAGVCAVRQPATRSQRPETGLRLRMRIPVDLGEPRRVEMCVLLRRRERSVAEELLDRAEVRAGLEQVRGEGVA